MHETYGMKYLAEEEAIDIVRMFLKKICLKRISRNSLRPILSTATVLSMALATVTTQKTIPVGPHVLLTFDQQPVVKSPDVCHLIPEKMTQIKP